MARDSAARARRSSHAGPVAVELTEAVGAREGNGLLFGKPVKEDVILPRVFPSRLWPEVERWSVSARSDLIYNG